MRFISFLLCLSFGALLQAQNWKLVFEDQFNGTQLNDSTWETSGGDWAYPLFADTNVVVNNGILELWAHDVRSNPIPRVSTDRYTSDVLYTASMILTRQKFRYGKFEFRAKLPTGFGLWPALWMSGINFNNQFCLPDTDDLYDYGEIDFEMAGGQPRYMSTTIHWTNLNQCKQDMKLKPRSNYLSNGNGIDHWHIYTIEWTPNRVKLFVDGDLFKSYSHNFTMGMFIWLNIGIGDSPGSDSFTQGPPHQTPSGMTAPSFPVRMEVDWVRVYKDFDCDEDLNICENHSNVTHPSHILGKNITYGGCNTANVFEFNKLLNPPNHTLQRSNSLELIATNTIRLTEGFHAHRFSRFKARLDACPPQRTRPDELVRNLPAENNLLSIVPNPNRGQFDIRIHDEALTQTPRLEVWNLLGQKVFDRILTDRQQQIDISNSPSGTYIVRLTANGQLLAANKMIKQ
ncbi:MAG: family 16 glycosylhydrolase [Bacteroidota bacterium]